MALKSMSVAALRRELAKREKMLKTLRAARDKAAKKLSKLDAQISAMDGGRGPGRPAGTRGRKSTKRRGRKPGPRKGSRRRAKNKLTLPDALVAAVRKGSTVSPAEAGKAVKANGYKSNSKTFGVQVATALTKYKRFKKVGRGQYQLVGSGPTAAKARKPRKATKKVRRRKKSTAKRKASAAKRKA